MKKNPITGLKTMTIPYRTYDEMYTNCGIVKPIIKKAQVDIFAVELYKTMQHPIDPLTKCIDMSLLYFTDNPEIFSFILN